MLRLPPKLHIALVHSPISFTAESFIYKWARVARIKWIALVEHPTPVRNITLYSIALRKINFARSHFWIQIRFLFSWIDWSCSCFVPHC